MARDYLEAGPVATLLKRVGAELIAEGGWSRTGRVARSPGRLDVMGGIADYTGSLVCELPLDRAAAVYITRRADRQVRVFSFNLLDDHVPFTLSVPVHSLAADTALLRKEFSAPGRKFAAYVAGCLHVLHKHGLIDATEPAFPGLDIAVYSDVPLGGGVSSSAALEVATMVGLLDELGLRDKTDGLEVAAMCQEVENQVVGAPCGIMDQVASANGRAGALLRMVCQPHELQGPLFLPPGTKVVGINSKVKHSVEGGQYGMTRCASFMGHKAILKIMGDAAEAHGRRLVADPMKGYLANLIPDDYKILFRPNLPEQIQGQKFLDEYGPTDDSATVIDPAKTYDVQAATDHHVLEAQRVRRFVDELAAATAAQTPEKRGLALDRAGHLMYASHESYGNKAMLGAPECDTLVALVRANEKAGLYGAKITGGGSGGTVAVLYQDTPEASSKIGEIIAEYEVSTGRKAELLDGSSDGGWWTGSREVSL